jgi:putative PIN family toxin of toxin-antitoxin system
MILHELVLTKQVALCLSDEIYVEYVEVMNRDKFRKYTDFKTKADIVLSKLHEISIYYAIDRKIDLLTDTSDNKFLELATSCQADYIITGNTLDFNIANFENTKIVTPREYWDKYKP